MSTPAKAFDNEICAARLVTEPPGIFGVEAAVFDFDSNSETVDFGESPRMCVAVGVVVRRHTGEGLRVPVNHLAVFKGDRVRFHPGDIRCSLPPSVVPAGWFGPPAPMPRHADRYGIQTIDEARDAMGLPPVRP